MLIILSGNQDSNFNPVLLKVKLCADLQTTKLVAQSSQSRPRNNLSFCSDDCSYQSQLRTIIWALHLTSPSEAFLDSEHFQLARRGPGCAASCSPSSRLSWSWPRSPSPSSTPSRWSRSTRGPSSSGWAGCCRGEPGAQACSSSFPVSMFTRRLIWELPPTRFLHKRYTVGRWGEIWN